MLIVTVRDGVTGQALLATGDKQLVNTMLRALAARLAEAGAHLDATLPPDDSGEEESQEGAEQ